MRVAIEALDLSVSDDELAAVDREVNARASAEPFKEARDLRLRLRRTKNALICVAAVGFVGGGLVTSTATRPTPIQAIVGALDELPERIERSEAASAGRRANRAKGTTHAAVRDAVRRLGG